MSNEMISPDDEFSMVGQSSDISISAPSEAEGEDVSALPLVGKALIAKEMAYRRSIEQLKEEKRLKALIADYDFDAL
jgi:hypothetical protein